MWRPSIGESINSINSIGCVLLIVYKYYRICSINSIKCVLLIATYITFDTDNRFTSGTTINCVLLL